MNATLDQVLSLAEELEPREQEFLINRLRTKLYFQRISDARSLLADTHRSPTREELLKELETLRATPVRPGESLMGKYANPDQPEISEAALNAQLHADATEWEQELDEFDPKHD